MTTVFEIENALKIAAKVVALYGDTYLPTFQRLHDEFLKVKEHEQKKMLALKLAESYAEL